MSSGDGCAHAGIRTVTASNPRRSPPGCGDAQAAVSLRSLPARDYAALGSATLDSSTPRIHHPQFQSNVIRPVRKDFHD